MKASMFQSVSNNCLYVKYLISFGVTLWVAYGLLMGQDLPVFSDHNLIYRYILIHKVI